MLVIKAKETTVSLRLGDCHRQHLQEPKVAAGNQAARSGLDPGGRPRPRLRATEEQSPVRGPGMVLVWRGRWRALACGRPAEAGVSFPVAARQPGSARTRPHRSPDTHTDPWTWIPPRSSCTSQKPGRAQAMHPGARRPPPARPSVSAQLAPTQHEGKERGRRIGWHCPLPG